MGDFLSKLFDTSDFPARWNCGNWSDLHGWLHILSDVTIFLAYFAIPLVLFSFARKRPDFPFHRLFVLFAAFILCCGLVHLIEATIFWLPIYRIGAIVKLLTAVVSVATVVSLVRAAPTIVTLPTLTNVNEELMGEVLERKRVEKKLRESNERLNALIRGTRNFIWTTDRNGGFVEPQVPWERFTGQSWDEHQGHGWGKAIHEDDLPELLRRWNEALETGEKYQGTGRLWHTDSDSYRAFVAEAIPLRDDQGEIREWIGTVNDIEEKQQIENDLGIAKHVLAQQKQELELIYQNSPIGMGLLDSQWRYLRVNESLARINGLSQADHIGKRPIDMLPALRDQLAPILQQVSEDRTPIVDKEITGQTFATEQQRTWLASFYPLELAENLDRKSQTDFAISVLVQDITDRKRQEERLRVSEQQAKLASRAKSEFLANMSHEIRTPMAAILGYADVLLGHLKDPDNRNCVQIIKRNGDHLLALINDILDISRIEAGKLALNIESVDIPGLLSELHSSLNVRAIEKGIDFDIACDGKIPKWIRTDATRLRQILINLLGNGIKFTDAGHVSLSVDYDASQNDSSMLRFRVSDTGIGISEEQKEKLFKPFSQGDATVSRKYGGTGLGLAISDRLAEMLGGTVLVKSEPEKGSTFTLTIPIAETTSLELVEPGDLVSKPTTDNPIQVAPKLNCRVLVVDDRRDVRHISQHFLEKAGATVMTAEDGEQAVEKVMSARASGEKFDAIVMDMHMPKVDGLEATARIRASGIDWPIIALTADAMKGDREKYLIGGCNDYLSKPIDHAQLIHTVARHCKQD